MAEREPREIIGQGPMSAFQIVAVALTVGLNALDGFDVLAITFASPGIANEWGVDRAALGIVISTGLIGMAFGSLFLAPIADKIGRRPTILGCLAAMAGGMFLSATASSVAMLSLWRVITGLGIGGMLASINAMAAEFSNDRRRDLSVSLMSIGYPIGGVVGGSFAAWLLQHHDWRSVFVFGGIVSALFIPMIWLRMPESISFLLYKRPADALERINRTLARMGHPSATRLPPPPPAHAKGSLADIFKPALIGTTLCITLAYLLHITAYYYVLSWIPKIVADMGFTASQGSSVSVWGNIGGAIGGATLGFLTLRFGLKPLTLAVMVGSAIFITLFGRVGADLTMMKLVVFLAIFFANSGVVGLYAVIAKVFPTHVRATGTGFVVGVGRAGGALAPIVSGFLFESGMGRAEVSMVMGACALGAAAALFLLRRQLHTAAE